MSVEFDIRFSGNSIPQKQLLDAITKYCKEEFQWDIQLLFDGNPDPKGNFGGISTTTSLTIGDTAIVQCLIYSAGGEEALGDEGGWWGGLAVALRTPESFLLLVLAAICLARILGTEIVDESRKLRGGRMLDANTLGQNLGFLRNHDFPNAALMLGKEFNVVFGDA